MNKRTKRNIIYNNKTKKYYGGTNKKTDEPEEDEQEDEQEDEKIDDSEKDTPPEGVFDIVGDKIADYSGDVAGYVGEKALRLVGLQPISSGDENESPPSEKINNAVTGFASQAESVGSSFVNLVNKTTGALIGQINGVLESPKVNQTVIQAAQETVETLTKLLTKFNKATNNPEFKAALELSLNNAADYANVFVEATDEPVNNAIDSLRDSGIKAMSGVASGAVKVATDAAAAVPGAGAIIDIGKMINDSTAAFGKVVEASSETVETLSGVLEKISKNLRQGIDKLDSLQNKASKLTDGIGNFKQKGIDKLNSLQNKANEVTDGVANFKKLTKDKLNISKRINSSIDNFENPLKSTDSVAAAAAGGGYKTKTKRKLFKRKAKSKRVRFST
jgi:ABC-type transporter Mla subunit MlaD